MMPLFITGNSKTNGNKLQINHPTRI